MAQSLAFSSIVLLLRWALGVVLLIAGISKLSDRAAFRQAVEAYQVLPIPAARFFARGLPYLEMLLGLCLVVGLGTRFVPGAAGMLFMSFSVAIGINLLRGRELDCHCFGKAHAEKIGMAVLIRSLLLSLCAALVMVYADGFFALDGWLIDGADSPSPMELAGLILLPLVITGVVLLISVAYRTLTGSTSTVVRSTRVAAHVRKENNT